MVGKLHTSRVEEPLSVSQLMWPHDVEEGRAKLLESFARI